MRLPDEQRAALAAALIESLDQNVDEDAEAAWSVEIARRLGEVERGQVRTIPWPEARRMILGRMILAEADPEANATLSPGVAAVEASPDARDPRKGSGLGWRGVRPLVEGGAIEESLGLEPRFTQPGPGLERGLGADPQVFRATA